MRIPLSFPVWIKDQSPCVQAAIMGPVPYVGEHSHVVGNTCLDCGMTNVRAHEGEVSHA